MVGDADRVGGQASLGVAEDKSNEPRVFKWLSEPIRHDPGRQSWAPMKEFERKLGPQEPSSISTGRFHFSG